MAKGRPRYHIVLKPGQDVEKALRILKKKYIKDKFFQELRLKTYFEKGSDKRIRKEKEMRVNHFKAKKLRERNL